RFQQVLIGVNDRAMESASKQVPPPVLSMVERSGITTVQPLHGTGNIWLRRANDEMNVVGH
ncbi:MAG TPA: hypothetical protein VK739_01095, partial [bacterium]|nr:hypothetical protein [bacterium]